MIRDVVEQAHRSIIHGIYEPGALDILCFAVRYHFVELWQVLGRYCQVGVEYHEDVARCGGEPRANGVALAFARLLKNIDSQFGMLDDDAMYLVEGPVGGVAFHEQDLQVFRKGRHSIDRGLDVAGFVSAGDHDRCGWAWLGSASKGPRNDIVTQAESAHYGEGPYVSVQDGTDAARAAGHK